MSAVRPRSVLAGGVGVLALGLLLGGCAGGATGPSGSGGVTPRPGAGGATPAPGAVDVAALPAGAVVDYQLGSGYEPAEGVTVVARDSTDEPAAGLYSICYVNGFQTQPGAEWPDELVLHDDSGAEVFDPGWPDERLIDIRTAEQRAGAAAELAPVIAGCAADGFQAVEFDNLDSYTRSDGALELEQAVAFATLLVQEAHANGLAAGQKNTPQLADRGRDEIGFDFVVAEECRRYDECASYTDVYGDQVIDIEYVDDLGGSVAEVCADPQLPPATVLRDRPLAPEGAEGHVYQRC